MAALDIQGIQKPQIGAESPLQDSLVEKFPNFLVCIFHMLDFNGCWITNGLLNVPMVIVDFKCQLGDTWYHHHQISLLLDARRCYRPYFWISIFLSIPCSESLHNLGITNTYDILKHENLHQWPSTPSPDCSVHLSEKASHWLSSWPFKFVPFLPYPNSKIHQQYKQKQQ